MYKNLKMRILKFSLLSVILLITACKKENKQPSCNGYDVKTTLFKIIKEQLQKELEEEYFKKNWNYYDLQSYALDNGLNPKTYIEKKKFEIENNAKENAIKVIENITLELDGVRLTKVEKELKRCECASDLIIDKEESSKINYTAQYTEDGNVYVELKY